MPSTSRKQKMESVGERSLFVHVSCTAGIMTIRPTGPSLSERESMIITAEVTPLMQKLGRDMRGLVLDLSDVKAMSSFGLGLCIELRNAAHSVGASTAIVGMSADLRDLFKMMKVDRLYTIAEPRNQTASAVV